MILDGISGMNESFRNAIMSLDRDKKRMTILSLLDKDLNLFKRIKALTDKNIGKMEHIKDIILMLREYVKVGEVEKKKFGEVMTPLELVKEMLATLPEDVWSNPELKWLDPANGTGPYPIMVIYKLMNGLAEWEPDAEKRYKHIIENMIYVCELQPKNMFLYMCAVDPFDTYKLNIYTGSFLEPEFDKHMKDVWGLEKFDIVIGNPPYNKSIDGNGTNAGSIYDEFVEKCTKYSNRVLFVIPLKWANNSFKEFRKNIISFGIDKLFILKEGDKIFSTTGVGEICFLSLLEKSKQFLIFELNTKYEVINSFNISLEIENKKIYEDGFILNQYHLNIVKKVMEKSNNFLSQYYKNPQLIKTNLLSKTNKIEIGNGINFNVRKSKKEDVVLNLNILDTVVNTNLDLYSYKVCFEKIYGGYTTNKFSNMDILEPNHITTEGISFFSFNTKNEAQNFSEFLNTQFIIFLRRIKQYDRSFTSMIFSYIPFLDFNINWTDDKLYNYFKISDDEIKIINEI
jgi:site-specific DNA-methyltransferase (adenine-specific)